MKKICLLFILCIFLRSNAQENIPAKSFAPPILPNMLDGTCYFDTAVQLLLNTPPLVKNLLKNKHLYKKTKLIKPFIEFAEAFFKTPTKKSKKIAAVETSYRKLVKAYGAQSGGDPGVVIQIFIKELSLVSRKNPTKNLYHKVFHDQIRTKYKKTELFMTYITDDKNEYRKNKWGLKFFTQPKGIVFIDRYVPPSEDKKETPLRLKNKNFAPLFKNYGIETPLMYELIGFDIFDTRLPKDEQIAPGDEELYYHSISLIKSQYLPKKPWFFCDDNNERNIKLQGKPSTTLGQHVTNAIYLPKKNSNIPQKLIKLSLDLSALASKV